MKKWLLVAAAGVVLVGAGLVAYGLYRKHQGRDIHGSPTQEFNTTETKAKPIKPTAKIRWPMYRFDAARQGAPEGVLQAVVPPFRPLWFFRAGSLVEFPPAIAYGKLYFANAKGTLFAVDGKHVRTAWHLTTHRCTAATPAVDRHTVYMTFLHHPPCNATRSGIDGEVVALDASTGKLFWKASAQQRLGPSGTFYSTPAVAYDRVYIGATDGKMYSYGATSGKLRWSHGTGGYVYASPAVWNRRVFSGSYNGDFYCFDAATGDVFWKFKSNGPISGSAVVINGIVYFATLKGWSYGLDAKTGKPRWVFRRGRYASVVTDRRRLYLAAYSRVFALAPKLRR